VSIERTSSGLELLAALDRRRGAAPLRAQLEAGLREAIRSGKLRAGTRLPSSRLLARDLAVTRGLVVECYAQLRAEGYLSARPGSATSVAAVTAAAPTTTRSSVSLLRPRFDLRPGLPDLSAFPRRDWAAAARRAVVNLPDAALGYGDPRGAPQLRQALGEYLGRVRGVSADPERIVITCGFAQARNVIFRVLKQRGARRVALEDPCPPETRRSVVRAGLNAIAVPVDKHGIQVAMLEHAAADAVVVTPAHQFPAGAVLAPDRRRWLLAWAREARRVVLEDDYDAEFRYDRDPVGSLQGLAPDRVIYAGSASKALAPALRIGWVVCPPELIDPIADAKREEDLGTSILGQLALADLLGSGRYDRHLRRARTLYRERRDALATALREHAPEVELQDIAAGIHAVATLPGRLDERQVLTAAARRSVQLYGMSAYRSDGAVDPPVLVLGYGSLTPSALVTAIAAVGDLLRAPAPG
jgi:GntR family transcriptional regulator/MocR family aminotransferase